jgi:hypothetical protein
MRHHLRLVLSLAVAVVSYGVLIAAFRWMSQPSDRAFYGGIAVVFLLLLVVPLVIQAIWRKL